MIDQLKKPEYDAPLVSWMPTLVIEMVNGHPYNIVGYGDVFWGISHAEGEFDAPRFLAGKARTPILLGETVEELKYGLDLMFPRKTGDFMPDSVKYFIEETTNIYHLRSDIWDNLQDMFPDSPAIKNVSIPRDNFFEMGDGLPICIISPAPNRSCNYRCEYCYHHAYGFKANKIATESWAKAILTAVEQIPRPLMLSMGAMGEPLYISKWREVVYQVLDHQHVHRVSFVSNLTKDFNNFFDRVDPKRIGVVASLHPSEFKDPGHNLETFLERITLLKDQGTSVVANYVLTPEQIDVFPQYRDKINVRGVPVTCNVLRGPYRGKMYPEAYSPEELDKIQEYYSKMPFIYTDQSHKIKPYGTQCTSGRYGFHLEFDGTLYNCHFARQKLGSIYDKELMVQTENGYCTSEKCESQTTIAWREDVVERYRTLGSMHHFVERPEKEIGTHPFL